MLPFVIWGSTSTPTSQVACFQDCFAVLRQIHSIRHCVPRQALVSLVVSLVLSRVDNGNATLAGVPAYAISRLQSALNAAARLVLSMQKYDSMTLLLQELH